jgi:hypothetical protein
MSVRPRFVAPILPPIGAPWIAPRRVRLLLCAALVAGACSASGQARAEWVTFADGRGTSVEYPREIFSLPTGEGQPPGPTLGSPDGRARLHIFTLGNEQRVTPAAFIRRAVTDTREHLSYRRVSNRFFVFSDARDDLILYRRCNFVASAIHCVDIRYPRGEKRAWDARVTRMSFSLHPR